jgi:hypothetical protein
MSAVRFVLAALLLAQGVGLRAANSVNRTRSASTSIACAFR